MAVIRARWENFDFNSTKLKNLASAISPAILRLGGTDADFLIFNNTDTNKSACESPCDEQNFKKESSPDYRTNFTMTVADWDNINKFAADVGWDILFDLNMLLRNGSDWDSTNANALLNYTRRKGYRIAGWELGNEPNTIKHHSNITVAADQLGKDFIVLRQMLDKLGFQESFLVGPDVAMKAESATDYVESFLRACGNTTFATTWHSYYVNVKDVHVENFTDPHLMDTLKKEIKEVQKLIQKYRPYLPKSWLGETAGISGGGAPGLSDAYAGGFLWLDKLGLSAKYGVDLVIRQSFYGNYYGLLDQDLNPTPCYWLSLLYKQLVGPTVLNANITVQDGCHNTLVRNPSHIRVYAHCSKNHTGLGSVTSNGSITVFVLNLLKKNSVSLFLSGDLASKTVHQYLLAPHDGKGITARRVDLNGEELKLTDSGTLPAMKGHKLDKDEPISLPPLTFGFYVIDANASLCF